VAKRRRMVEECVKMENYGISDRLFISAKEGTEFLLYYLEASPFRPSEMIEWTLIY